MQCCRKYTKEEADDDFRSCAKTKTLTLAPIIMRVIRFDNSPSEVNLKPLQVG